MNIIRSTANSSGAYPPIQSWVGTTPPDGWYQVSDTCDTSAMQTCGGFVTLTVTDNVVTAITGNETAYATWKAANPENTTPTEQERLRADVDYIAAMEGVDL